MRARPAPGPLAFDLVAGRTGPDVPGPMRRPASSFAGVSNASECVFLFVSFKRVSHRVAQLRVEKF